MIFPGSSASLQQVLQDAFPDNRCTINVAVAEGNEAVQESVFTGTHTETFHVPGSPDIPATGKSVALPYTLGDHLIPNGKWSSFRLLFDRAELMTQLGLMLVKGESYRSMRPSALSAGEGHQEPGRVTACPLRARTEEPPRAVTVYHGQRVSSRGRPQWGRPAGTSR